jgi:hypothetical protein
MKVVEAKALSEFCLFVRFDDGVSGVVDLSAMAGRGVLSSWLRPGVFDRVQVTDVGAVEWPGEIDLCPDSLYLQVTGKSPEDLFPALGGRLAHA